MTREEYDSEMNNCVCYQDDLDRKDLYINSLEQQNTALQSELEERISESNMYLEALHKCIESLESQLANTEQLKCETRSNFLELVTKERTRQIVEKGYTIEHDDEHTDGSIATAAACYAVNGNPLWVKNIWPFEREYFKKEDHARKQQLIIAAALINAEYDRIVRSEQKGTR